MRFTRYSLSNFHLGVVAGLFVVALPAVAEQAINKKRPVRPVFAPIEDKPGLPRVLLVGDSISIGYTLRGRKGLSGVANVHRPPTNCGHTAKGLAELDKWLGDKRWDLIHFNFGLHDLKYVKQKDPAQLAKPHSPGSVQLASLEEYEANLRKRLARLEKTGARLIWRNTTPVPELSLIHI